MKKLAYQNVATHTEGARARRVQRVGLLGVLLARSHLCYVYFVDSSDKRDGGDRRYQVTSKLSLGRLQCVGVMRARYPYSFTLQLCFIFLYFQYDL